MDIKDKTQLKLKREDTRELVVTVRGRQRFRGGDEARMPGNGNAELCHDILGFYI